MKLYKCIGKFGMDMLCEYYGRGINYKGETYHTLVHDLSKVLCDNREFKQYFVPMKCVSGVMDIFEKGQIYCIDNKDYVVASIGENNLRLMGLGSWSSFEETNLYNMNINEYFMNMEQAVTRIK